MTYITSLYSLNIINVNKLEINEKAINFIYQNLNASFYKITKESNFFYKSCKGHLLLSHNSLADLTVSEKRQDISKKSTILEGNAERESSKTISVSLIPPAKFTQYTKRVSKMSCLKRFAQTPDM